MELDETGSGCIRNGLTLADGASIGDLVASARAGEREGKHMEISIDWISVETGIWHIQRCLIQKHGTHVASIDIEPLVWYIKTGRASADFLRALLEAKPFMVARKLHEGGSYDEVLKRVKMYIGWEEEA